MHEEDEKRVGKFFGGAGEQETNQARPQLEMSKICSKAGIKKYKPYHNECSCINNEETEQVVTKFVIVAKRDFFLNTFSSHRKYFEEYSEINLHIKHITLCWVFHVFSTTY
jgi:hypothetical protein